MPSRKHLRSQLERAWSTTISCQYRLQRINSEASLQAAFWSNINAILAKENPDDRRLFIEPSIRISWGTGEQATTAQRYPDIVVCSPAKIIAVVELKYSPRMKPSSKKDLSTFALLSRSTDVSIKNDRYRGDPFINTVYALSADVLYVWAGIHKSAKGFKLGGVPAELAPHFLELHETTA